MRHFPLLLIAAARLAADPCATASSRAVLAPPSEPGQRMVVSGRVFLPDGRTPAAGVYLYAYQTDQKGEYGDTGAGPRLRGWMKTDAQGRYELESIRPAPYPGNRIPAHVHFQAWSASLEPRYTPELQFEDHERGGGRDSRQGTLRITYDIRIPAGAPRLPENAMHGIRACQGR